MKLNSSDRVACTHELKQLRERCRGVQATMLALRDGRSFTHLASSSMDVDKFAAMSSSLVALGDTMLRELDAGTFDHVLVDGSRGKLVVSKISGCGGLLILATLATADTRPGLVLGYTRTCALSICEALRTARNIG